MLLLSRTDGLLVALQVDHAHLHGYELHLSAANIDPQATVRLIALLNPFAGASITAVD